VEYPDVLKILVAGCVVLASCAQPTPSSADVATDAPSGSGVIFGRAQIERVNEMGFPGPPPVDETNHLCDDLRAATLGHLLFFDPKLSANGAISCATCHQPERAFTDGLKLNMGLTQGVRNTLSILDAAHQTWFNWDGRFDSLWSQAHGPLTHPREMGSNFQQIAQRVHDDARLRIPYEAIFGRMPPQSFAPADVELIIANIGKALAAYERRLVTGHSPFDRWVDRWRAVSMPRELDRVPAEDFSPQAQRGLDLFTSRGLCWQCHVGPLLSDGEFHALGAAPHNNLISDAGRYDAVAKLKQSPFRSSGAYSDNPKGEQGAVVDSLVGQPDQWGAFRTPTLRNVALTAPYFHQGQFATLEDVLAFYSTLEGSVTIDHHRESVLRRRDFSKQEMAEIMAFLQTLNGTPPPHEWTVDPWQTIPHSPESAP